MEESKIRHELSRNEKRVLMAISELGGKATPEEIIEQALPPALNDLTDVLKTQLNAILEDFDRSLGDSKISELMMDLASIKADNDRQLESRLISILVRHISHILVDLEVPLQRKILGRVIGEIQPAISKSLRSGESKDIRLDMMTMVDVMNSSSWLRSKSLLSINEGIDRYYSLSSKRLAGSDLPERRALKLVDKNHGSITVDELRDSKKLRNEEVPIAMGWLKRKGWVTIQKQGDATVLELTELGRDHITKKGKDELLIENLAVGELPVGELDTEVIGQLKKRQDILVEREVIVRKMELTSQGLEIVKDGLDLGEDISQLTQDMIKDGSWKQGSIRPYDVEAFAPNIHGGRRHPLQQYIDMIRRIFLDMGFTEIESDYVHSAFWNMDALFTAQDHPARELHDTLYLKNPNMIPLPDDQIVDKVKTMHESGDTDSDGWGYDWKASEAQRALLRTHTTVNTISYLRDNPNPPVKVFSIGRVFRKEAVDATHLPEFIQIEGIVMEEGANMDMLAGLIKEFYHRMGVDDIRLRPGYFPYTEPSIEPEIKHHGNWMELGGAGIFRPEVVAPFGVEYPVLAWGLGLERLVMALLNLKDIRKLYVSDIDWLRTNPVVK